jgi:hypothetical protein
LKDKTAIDRRSAAEQEQACCRSSISTLCGRCDPVYGIFTQSRQRRRAELQLLDHLDAREKKRRQKLNAMTWPIEGVRQ